MTKFYFGKTRENTGKTWENMQKHGKAQDDKVLVQENMGKHREFLRNSGKTWENIGKTLKERKKMNTFVKNRMTKFNFRKTQDTGKIRENTRKHGKTSSVSSHNVCSLFFMCTVFPRSVFCKMIMISDSEVEQKFLYGLSLIRLACTIIQI